MGQPEVTAKFQNGTARVGVIGLGYVGLPLCMAFIDGGLTVTGIDIDREKTEALARGETYLSTIPAERIRKAQATGRFSATTDTAALAECDGIIICVPTPLGESREPDLRYIRTTTEDIAGHLRPGQLVVLESTTYPGTTEEVCKPLLEASGLRCGHDFWLAFSPEREDPGNPDFHTSDIPKLVGGLDAPGGDLAELMYRRAFRKVIRVSHAKVAEAAKLTENIYRSVNIALVNELKVVYEALGIDVWEVIAAAASKPFGYQPFYPGPGLGGHCIPIDPFYLTWKAAAAGVYTRFIELAGEINAAMPERVVHRVQDVLNNAGKAMKGSKVLVLGVAYKGGVSDTRESPGLELVELLRARGAEVVYHDPLVAKLGRMRRHTLRLENRPLSPALIEAQDVVLLATTQPGMDLELVAKHSKVIVDTRNAFANIAAAAGKVVKA
jgi:UDP-N-acetyl-D-glucosamine dehydrogenase